MMGATCRDLDATYCTCTFDFLLLSGFFSFSFPFSFFSSFLLMNWDHRKESKYDSRLKKRWGNQLPKCFHCFDCSFFYFPLLLLLLLLFLLLSGVFSIHLHRISLQLWPGQEKTTRKGCGERETHRQTDRQKSACCCC